MLTLWQEIELGIEEDWEWPGDSNKYKMKLENERVYEFLANLNCKFYVVRGRILGQQPLQSTHEVFAKVQQEESCRQIMSKKSSDSSDFYQEVSTLPVKENKPLY